MYIFCLCLSSFVHIKANFLFKFQIAELKKQLNTVQISKSELIDSGAHSGYQKSAFMEEFEGKLLILYAVI